MGRGTEIIMWEFQDHIPKHNNNEHNEHNEHNLPNNRFF